MSAGDASFQILLPQLLKREKIRKRSGFEITSGAVLPLRSKDYDVIQKPLDGDAPKDFIRVYAYGQARRDAPRKWPAYIAKVGHKWYPNESITEHLLTRIGQELGLNMAHSCLRSAHGQIRFLSRYFLGPNENLVHGTEIFAGYLEDEAFVQEVEEAKAERDFFTFQFVREAIRAKFPDQAPSILEAYTRMLAFDAIVGNNDRHHYNWGVIVYPYPDHLPHFSPIYDSARGLFWNDPEEKLQKIEQDADPKRLRNFLDKYIRNSRPKTGWERIKSLNHIDLISNIFKDYPPLRPVLANLCDPRLVQNVRGLLGSEFGALISPLRQRMILRCLQRRLELLSNALKTGNAR